METGRTEPGPSLWPREILSLPQVVVPISGVIGHCLRNDDRQVVFFEMDEGTSFPDHNHCEQWGTVVAGEMTLEIGGHTDLYQQGEAYHIPEGASHRASFSERTFLIDLFARPDRYPVQP